jgi:hypothetical protein
MQYGNDTAALKRMMNQVATIMERLDAQNQQTLRQVEGGVAALDHSARHLNGTGEQFGSEALQVIGAQAQQVIGQGVALASTELGRQLQESADKAKWAAHALSEQRQLLTSAQNALVWKGLIALAAGSLLALAGCGFYAWHTLREVKNADFGRDILQATQTGTLTRCGEALCVKVGKNPEHYGPEGEYVLLPQ